MDAVSCGEFTETLFEKLVRLSENSEWLLQNGCRYGSYEATINNYDLWLRSASFRSFGGITRHKDVYNALNEYYGDKFLKLLNAYDKTAEETWTARITHFPNSLLHPLYHLLMVQLLAGSAKEFFEKECAETLPFGPGPWPCHNPVCPKYLLDVIEKYDDNPYSGYMHARFECPVCGMVYRRKKAMPKEEQYKRKPKIEDYGPLWNETLRRCLIDMKMTARETCRFMHCDFYTVNRHALINGFLTPDEVYSYSRPAKEKQVEATPPPPMSDDELRQMYRSKWLSLIENNPDTNRSRLMNLERECYLWLRKNDTEWYEQNSPAAKYASFDWAAQDAENLEMVRAAVEELHNAEGRPRWISRRAVIMLTGLNQLSNNRALEQMPRTSDFLEKNLESIEEWRKRKIVWAIRTLRERGAVITLYKINIAASMSYEAFGELEEFARECLLIE